MSDDGSEIDSKYNIHLSFIIVVQFKSQIPMMLMFRLFFVLYFVKLSVGNGFNTPNCVSFLKKSLIPLLQNNSNCLCFALCVI